MGTWFPGPRHYPTLVLWYPTTFIMNSGYRPMAEDATVLVLASVGIPVLRGPLLDGLGSLAHVHAGGVQVDVHKLPFLNCLKVAFCADMQIDQTSFYRVITDCSIVFF